MTNSTIGNIVLTGLNNPDCAFYTGAFFGQMSTTRIFILLWAGLIALKAIDKLDLKAILEYIYKSFKKIIKKPNKKRQ
jgi:hypothetical protein